MISRETDAKLHHGKRDTALNRKRRPQTHLSRHILTVSVARRSQALVPCLPTHEDRFISDFVLFHLLFLHSEQTG